MKRSAAAAALEYRWLIAAYGMLALLGAVDVFFGPVRFGILVAIPLVLIGFFGSRRLAVATALPTAVIFAFLDNDVIPPRVNIIWTIQTDAAFLAVTFIAIILTADRLRSSEAAAGSDALTSLLNRRSLEGHLARAIDRAARNGSQAALLFVDLDDFKIVNDRCGHDAGDRVLQIVAQRLLHGVRSADSVGRIGGDEFLVLLESVPDRAHAESVARGIEAALAEPYSSDEGLPEIGATIGLAMFPADGRDPGALTRYADANMYERKKRKRAATSAASA